MESANKVKPISLSRQLAEKDWQASQDRWRPGKNSQKSAVSLL